MNDDDLEVLARGIVCTMSAVSQARKSVMGDAWESESAEVVVRTLRAGVADDAECAPVYDRALELWPSSLRMLVDGELDPDDSLVDVMTAATTAARVLSADGYDDYAFALRNVAIATAAAAAEDGVLEVGGDHVTDAERSVIDTVDAILS